MEWRRIKKSKEFQTLLEKLFLKYFHNCCPKCKKTLTNSNDFLFKIEELSSDIFTQEGKKKIRDVKICFRCLACKEVFCFELDPRRDTSDIGICIRNKFGQILEIMANEGIDREDARKQILNLLEDIARIYYEGRKEEEEH